MTELKGGYHRPVRLAIAGLMAILLIPLIVAGCAQAPKASEPSRPALTGTVTISGAGTGYPPLELLAREFESRNAGVRVNFLPASQTSGALTAVLQNVSDIGAVTRPPKPEETQGRIQYAEFAADALLLAAHPSVKGITNLKTEDIRAVYSGAVKNWAVLGGPDAAILILDRSEDESAKILLRQHVLGKDLTISSAAIVLKQENELIAALKDTPNSVGVFSLAFAIINGLNVSRIGIDGVAPSVETVKTGRYPMVRVLGLVWTDSISPAGRAFSDFIQSDDGRRILEKSGYAGLSDRLQGG